MKNLKIGVLCGGPSAERGISLNSARSVCDHLEGDGIEVFPFYFDIDLQPYQISRGQLYSNTPSDFDFKLKQISKPLSDLEFHSALRSMDMVFPAMHGAFGEDGGVQSLLESLEVPFVGSGSQACKLCFDKFNANEFIRKNGFFAPQSLVIQDGDRGVPAKIEDFFRLNKLARGVVKPANGGSSIGVFSVRDWRQAVERVDHLRSLGYKRVVLEPFAKGKEFTVVILQNRFGQPVSLLPVEIETDYSGDQLFDYRRKYLPTRQSSYHCPPRFPEEVVEKIQVLAEQLFILFGMRDFARFDGWFLDDGSIWFSDFNPISGMEQNSFLFLQAARVGMSHRNTLLYVLRSVARRHGMVVPSPIYLSNEKRKPVSVIFGGDTAERQVSVMSGTNIWLKLMRSRKYDPHPHLLDLKGRVWRLPYSMTLNHTVEEISYICERAAKDEIRNRPMRERVITKLSAQSGEVSVHNFVPEMLSLDKFIRSSKFVFLGLHGGIGEDGRLQNKLEKAKVKYNGSPSSASKLAMDKFETGEQISELKPFGIYSAARIKSSVGDLRKLTSKQIAKFWLGAIEKLGGRSIIVKPMGDGCSAGVARLWSREDLVSYLTAIKKGAQRIEAGVLSNQRDIIEMPHSTPKHLLFERFVETDRVMVVGNKLIWEPLTGWIEVTVGVYGRAGSMRAMNPSLTVASGDVLSLEEKFQGGTGINITPPPQDYVAPEIVAKAKQGIELVAGKLGLAGYARIDAFLNIRTGELIIIEANSLPGLTPSTVIFHQALQESPGMYPRDFLEKIVELGGY